MRFRLLYEGRLLGATQRNPRSEHKHEIRRRFHSQLKKLWKDNPYLMGVPLAGRPEREAYDYHPTNLAEIYRTGNYKCTPLVMEEDRAMVDISVLLLRPGPIGVVVQSGDLDARLSTLFDALQIPPVGTNFGKYINPAEDETPFFCLLQNDKLIGRATVEADSLLGSIYRRDKGEHGESSFDINDAIAIITVEIKPTVASGFLSRF